MALLLLFVLPLSADEGEKKKEEEVSKERREAVRRFSKAQQTNRRKFHGHRWTKTEEARLNREPRARRSFLMSLDKEGKLGSILRSSVRIQSRNPKLRMAVTDADRKAERELIQWVEAAEKVINQYVYYETNAMARMLLTAEVVDGRGAFEKTFQATGRGLIARGDLVRVWLDPESLEPLRLEYHARVAGTQVTGWVTYRRHKATGGYFPDRSQLDCRARNIQLILRNTTPVSTTPTRAAK